MATELAGRKGLGFVVVGALGAGIMAVGCCALLLAIVVVIVFTLFATDIG